MKRYIRVKVKYYIYFNLTFNITIMSYITKTVMFCFYIHSILSYGP